MPLDIDVKGNPASLRITAQWLQSTSDSVLDAATEVYGARSDSEHGWTGHAGDGFRTAVSEVGSRVDQLSEDLTTVGAALEAHADDLDTVVTRMTQAWELASRAGCPVTATTITEPDPSPARAEPAAQDAYRAKVEAFRAASEVVAQAREKEQVSQQALLAALRSLAGRRIFSISEIATGLTGAAVTQPASQFRQPSLLNRSLAYLEAGIEDFECPLDDQQYADALRGTADGTNFGPGVINGPVQGTRFHLFESAEGGFTGFLNDNGTCIPDTPPDPEDIHPPPPPPPIPEPDRGFGEDLEKVGRDALDVLSWPGRQVEEGLNDFGERLPAPVEDGSGPFPAPPPLPRPGPG